MKKITSHILLPLFLLINVHSLLAQEEDIFNQFQQILPRGGIPAIINPVYISAEEASISDNTWVLGVVINGQARAYSLNLLNHHEVVNDMIDTTAFAAVW